ncbi:hypothetical protein D3C72_2534250 [compost metagenome]
MWSFLARRDYLAGKAGSNSSASGKPHIRCGTFWCNYAMTQTGITVTTSFCSKMTVKAGVF